MCDLKYVIPHKYIFALLLLPQKEVHLEHLLLVTKLLSAHSEMCSALLASYYLTIRVLLLGRDLLDSDSA